MIKPDSNLSHLLPDFEKLVVATLLEANRESAGKFEAVGFKEWKQYETYRSVLRQKQLYAQGRSTPGDIVTYTDYPGYHGYGIACDSVWWDHSGNPHWDGPDALWEVYFHCAALRGLEVGGRWPMRDKPHVQAPHTTIAAWRIKAKKYLKSLGLSTP